MLKVEATPQASWSRWWIKLILYHVFQNCLVKDFGNLFGEMDLEKSKQQQTKIYTTSKPAERLWKLNYNFLEY